MTDYLPDYVEIERLKSRYLRWLDERRWQDWIELFADDATLTVVVSDQEVCRWQGKSEILSGNMAANADSGSIHHCHTPDIIFESATEAKAVWALFETIIKDETRTNLHGYYKDDYIKQDNKWLVKNTVCQVQLL